MSRHDRAGVVDKCATLFSEALPKLISIEVTQNGSAIRELNVQLPAIVNLLKRYAFILRAAHAEDRSGSPDGGKYRATVPVFRWGSWLSSPRAPSHF